MHEIKGTSISLTRGDTFYTTVGIRIKGTDTYYTPQTGDTLRFVLKRPEMAVKRASYKDTVPLIEKQIPIDTLQLKLVPADTKPLSFGTYVYDIELTKANGDVDTVINNAAFEILPEVD